ncbi:probable serine/threonine-protein kinase nek3 [Anthonomus grandis grandis]|uniref:probable serine/threonine-protein kinase nek3 n=1 Tax=Anthonomus grandis grandis TaxID=2921223 RepID=UPI002165BC16|nr:probable serine/threonine-protein kinase nek3 [Anthonomus grandis grandis]
MAVYLHTLTFLVTFCSFGEGQKYFPSDPDNFYADQQKTLNPQSLSFQQGNSFFPGGYFSTKDLETSDLPSHLQQTLPQYQQQSFLQEGRFRPSVPGPFKLSDEYVKPSTYKPHYAPLVHQQQDYYPKPIKANNNAQSNKLDSSIVLSNHHKSTWAKDGHTNQVDTHFTKRESAENVDNQRRGRDQDFEEKNDDSKLGESTQSEDNDVDEDLEEEYDEYEDNPEEDYEEEDEEENNNETYEVLTMRTTKTSKDDNFDEFVDVDSLDTTTQEPSTSNRLGSPPVAPPQKQSEDEQHFPQLVVSVVTSKTIVNNTIISPERTVASTTESTHENSTDSWIVIASVQTSRSISGAHFIPSSEVNQSVEKKLLNEVNTEKPLEYDDNNNRLTTPMSPVQKVKTSTESLIDKLDRVQSDLSSGLLSGGYNNDNIAVIKESPSTIMETTTPQTVVSTKKYPQVKIKSFDASNRLSNREKNKTSGAKKKGVTSTTSRPTLKSNLNNILEKSKPVDISAFLPPGYKPPPSTSEPTLEKTSNSIFSKAKPIDDISALLPPGYKPLKEENAEGKTKLDDISALLPPGYKPLVKEEKDIVPKIKPITDISSLLPPGYKLPQTDSSASKGKSESDNSSEITTGKSVGGLLSKAKPVEDISALLPPGYKGFSKPKVTTQSSVRLETVSQSIPAGLLPPGYKPRESNKNADDTVSPVSTTASPELSEPSSSTTSKAVKLIFPSRPGGGARKSSRLTTARANEDMMNKPTVPTIHKGWPSRATTEFTGWPTPSTTPISIEKLLEAARAAARSTSTEAEHIETTSTTTTTTTTTTTPRPTTPGICDADCDLEGTIKLVGSKAQWVPELLDRNTKEYQLLENSVRTELENIYSSSPILKQWYKKIRIDAFSEGSILVDYVVEFDQLPRKINTQEIKRYFHETLGNISVQNREGKSLNETKAEKFTLGQFQLDPKYTEFIVRPKSGYYPVDGVNNEDVLLPQWAIAVIVIGLASLLFVIIFGVTVLINRHRNSKKNPTPLTEDMLNDLNKSHMGGYDNYNSDDFYNMDDVWSDPPHFEEKPYKKRHNGGSLYDNSTANLYGSWGSQQWDGQQWNNHKNNYYNAANSHYSGRSAYARGDTDF